MVDAACNVKNGGELVGYVQSDDFAFLHLCVQYLGIQYDLVMELYITYVIS